MDPFGDVRYDLLQIGEHRGMAGMGWYSVSSLQMVSLSTLMQIRNWYLILFEIGYLKIAAQALQV